MNSKNKTYVITGGGSGGHVSPNFPIITRLQNAGARVVYIGSRNGIEKEMVMSQTKDVSFIGISAGKLRRYLDWKNLRDIFLVMIGLVEACFHIIRIRPVAIFSKGGFVAVPVVIAGWLLGVPVFIHEADRSMGLANRISSRFAKKIFFSFDVPKNLEKGILSGLPVRDIFYETNPVDSRKNSGIPTDKPLLLITGGSLGSRSINEAIWRSFDWLTSKFYIIHLTGKNNSNKNYDEKSPYYQQYEFVTDSMVEMLARCDLVVSRAGSNTLFELLALKKPALYIPLTRAQSRGDQIENVAWAVEKGFGYALYEEDMSKENFEQAILNVWQKHADIEKAITEYQVLPSADIIISELLKVEV